MELVQKIVKQKTTTGTTTGCTECWEIIPDLDAVYYFKINLTSEIIDIGFFDAYVPEEEQLNYDTGEYETVTGDVTEEEATDDIIDIPPLITEDLPVTVETGFAWKWFLDGTFLVRENKVIDSGGVAITEYGMLYTQLVDESTDERLRYDNQSIDRDVNIAYIAPETYFISAADNATPNVLTYYRAYAKNINDVYGYGDIKTVTVEVPVDEIDGLLRI